MSIMNGPVVWGGDKVVCLGCGRALIHLIDSRNQRIVAKHDTRGCENDEKTFALPLQQMIEVHDV